MHECASDPINIMSVQVEDIELICIRSGHELRCVVKAVRTQFQEDDDEHEVTYVGDQEDGRHAYYCVGAVWRSVMRNFAKSARISAVISKLFLDKLTAEKEGLPTNEVNSRYVVCL